MGAQLGWVLHILLPSHGYDGGASRQGHMHVLSQGGLERTVEMDAWTGLYINSVSGNLDTVRKIKTSDMVWTCRPPWLTWSPFRTG